MKFRQMAVVAGAAVALAVPVHAQLEPNGLNAVELKGKLEAMAGYQLQVKGDDENDYTVVLDPSASTFRYQGTASTKYLRPGLMVRFSAEFDQFGNPQSPLKQIEIFTPRKDALMLEEEIRAQTLGIYPADAATSEQAEDAKNNPSIPPAKPANNVRVKPEKQKRKPGSQPARKDKPFQGATAGNVQGFRVVGRLANMQADKIQVITGVQPLIVQLDPSVQITVSAGDATFCEPGDSIVVNGLSRSIQPGLVQAKSITVTAAKPLAPPERIVGKPDAKNGKSDAKNGKSDESNQTAQALKRRK